MRAALVAAFIFGATIAPAHAEPAEHPVEFTRQAINPKAHFPGSGEQIHVAPQRAGCRIESNEVVCRDEFGKLRAD